MSIIAVNNLSKRYRIAPQEGYLALRDTLAFMIKNPWRWIKSKMDNSAEGDKNAFWALKDVNFNVEQGEVLGIIGRNGAGKSTLLKILSRITPPSEGEIRLQGRVGSLLEVGTGFHPELTGRENIFLNGAILGMKRREIVANMDKIIEFSGVEKFIDMPVKRYSSGMFVRLAFAVAAHLEPDILIIDEVLAVGDAEFQKKCLNKMQEVTQKEGRTVLFVSHNMAAIEAICTQTMWLADGKIKKMGDTFSVVQNYLNDINAVKESQVHIEPDFRKDITFTKIWITDRKGNITNTINVEDEFKIWLEFQVKQATDLAEISIGLKNSSGVNVTFTSLSDSFNKEFYNFEPGTYTTSTLVKGNFLLPDNYSIRISAHYRGTRDIDLYEDILRLIIIETGASTMAPYGPLAGKAMSAVLSGAQWEINKNGT